MRPLLLLPLLLALLLPAACARPGDTNGAPLSYAHLVPIRMDVSEITVEEDYYPPMRTPNVDHEFPTPPAEAMKQWTRDRLKAAGSERELVVLIKDASVIETKLEPKTKGVKGLFTDDQAVRYDAKLVVELRVYGERAISEASINASATRSSSLPESASAAEREALYRRMTRQLMDSLNAELEKNIHQHFNRYVRYTGE